MTLGIGIGWLEEEFNALGISFRDRAALTEESVRAMRQLWGADAKPFSGEHFEWNAVESHPKPIQPGGIPIVVGGHADGAARRAARVGDGFFPMARGEKSQEDRLAELFEIMRAECGRVGRDAAEIEITAGGLIQSLDDVKRYQDLGVSRVVGPPPGFAPDDLERGLEQFGDSIISKV